MIRVTVCNAHSRYRVPKERYAEIVRRVLRTEGCCAAALNVIFIDSRVCRTLNRSYLHHDYITDVISFPLGEEGKKMEGEVYVNLDRARRQAQQYGVRVGHERARLVIHGILHLVGYDDRTPGAARRMHVREEGYLRRFFEHTGGVQNK